jgi:hypothetical protein
VRCFPTKEVASRQVATDSSPSVPRGQSRPAERLRPSGEREICNLYQEILKGF